jgi:hypothetical protein
MKNALFTLFVQLVIAGLVYGAGEFFTNLMIKKAFVFLAGAIALIAVIGFIAFLLGVSNPFPL